MPLAQEAWEDGWEMTYGNDHWIVQNKECS